MNFNQRKKADTLRERAEQLQAGSSNALDTTELTDLKQMAHELAAHQAELEFQNEELRQTQLALRETRDRFAALYEYAPVGYVVLDSSGIIRQANNTWRVMVNRADEDFRGSPFADTIFPEDASIFLARFRTFFRNPAKKQIVVRMKRKGSAPFHAQIEAEPRATKPQKHTRTNDELMIIVSDITHLGEALLEIENKNVELGQINERLDHINRVLLAIRNVNQLIVQESDPSRLIDLACENLTETMGYFCAWIALLENDDTAGPKMAASGLSGGFEAIRERIIDGEYPPCMRRALDLDETVVVKNPKLDCPDCPLSSEYAGRAGFIRRLSFGGKTYGILSVSVPENYAYSEEEQGLFNEVSGDLAFAFHKIELATRLAESQRRYLEIFEKSRDGFVMVDKAGRIIDANRAYCDMLGYSLDELRAMPDFYRITPERWREWEAEEIWENRLLRHGYSGLYEKEYIRGDGSVFPVELHSYTVRRKNGEIEYLWGTVRDVSRRKQREDRIALLGRMIDEAPAAITIHNTDGRFVYANSYTATLHGYKDEKEFLTVNLRDLDVPESEALLAERFRRIAETGEARFEVAHYRKDGSTFPLEVLAKAIEWQGQYAVLSIAADISDRVEADERLRLTKDRLELAANAAGFGVWDLDLKRNMLVWDDGMYRLYGMAPEDFEGAYEAWQKGVHPEDVGKASREVELAIAGEKEFDTEFRVVYPSGEIHHIKAYAMVSRDGSGEPVRMTGINFDITDRKKAEEALRESELFLRQTQQAARLGGWKTNPLTDELKWTDGVYDIIEAPSNYHPGLAEGLKYFCSEYLPVIKEALNRCLSDGHSFSMEVEMITDKGKKRWVELRGFSRGDSHNEPVIMGTIQDISDRKQAVEDKKKLQAQLQQAQKMEAVGTLAGGISHDFNNLLQAIDGYAELLLMDRSERDSDYRFLKAIQNAGGRAADLIRQLLLFSRKAESNKRAIELQHEVGQAKRMLERTIPKMIEIQIITGNRIWTINADPVQIEQMLLNLGTNAADAMPDGGRFLFEIENATLDADYAKRHLGAEPGRYVLLSVSDTGHGMDQETVNKIFDPFFTTKEFGKGTGLGLASVYGIVKSHGGYITCYSEAGKGTTFKIYFPAIVQPETEEIEEVEAKPIPRGTETILIVDDEEDIRGFARQALMKFGYRVLTASNGEEALELYSAKSTEIDLVVMDLGMPGMGGHKCLQEMRKLDRRVRGIIASGYSINGQVKKSLEAGARGYVGKPYKLADLLKTVREALDGDPDI